MRRFWNTSFADPLSALSKANVVPCPGTRLESPMLGFPTGGAGGLGWPGSEALADVVLLNTCSVRDAAEQKALGQMENLAAEVRRARPNQVFGFMGCMAQSRGANCSTCRTLISFSARKNFIARLNISTKLFPANATRLWISPKSRGAKRRSRNISRTRRAVDHRFVSIMQGCNQYCTFCIVPYTRGEERSRTIPEIVAECRGLVAHGVKEITLLGQIVTSYGKRDIGIRDGKSAFVQLLEAVHEIEGLERIRFTSPHPKGYGDDLVEAYGRLPKLSRARTSRCKAAAIAF